jgi:hypothetical protein
MPSGPDDPGKIMVIVKTAGIGGRTTVTQQQCAGVTFGLSLGDRLVEFDPTVWAETDVAMRIDQARQDPATVEDCLGTAHGLTAQDTVGDPPLDVLFIGQPAATDVEHRGGHRR